MKELDEPDETNASNDIHDDENDDNDVDDGDGDDIVGDETDLGDGYEQSGLCVEVKGGSAREESIGSGHF